MDAFKIENFQRDNAGDKFPDFKHLSVGEASGIMCKWKEKVGLPQESSPLMLTQVMHDKCLVVDGRNASDIQFNLISILGFCGIEPMPKVYVNWYRYDNIDEFLLDDLINYFDDIWYPASDDIEVFDASFSWILSVSHDGVIAYESRTFG